MTRNPLLNPELDIHELARIHDLARAYALQLRREAINAFWHNVFGALKEGVLRSTGKTAQNPR